MLWPLWSFLEDFVALWGTVLHKSYQTRLKLLLLEVNDGESLINCIDLLLYNSIGFIGTSLFNLIRLTP